jgi:hypothetical protein
MLNLEGKILQINIEFKNNQKLLLQQNIFLSIFSAIFTVISMIIISVVIILLYYLYYFLKNKKENNYEDISNENDEDRDISKL